MNRIFFNISILPISFFCIFWIWNKTNRISSIKVELLSGPSHWALQSHYLKVRERLQEKFNLLVGKTFSTLPQKKIKSIIKSEPFVMSEYIIKVWSKNSYYIGIKPAQSGAFVLHSDGLLYPVSLNGALLAPLDSLEHMPDLPILRGISFFKSRPLRRQALDFLNLLPMENGALNRKHISEINYSPKDKSLNLVLSQNGKVIRMGHFLNEKKVRRVARVLAFLEQKNILWKQMDARLNKKVVVSTLPQHASLSAKKL